MNDAELAFVMEAVKMVATEGWKLLPQYIVDLNTGEWRHHTNAVSKDRKWLANIRYVDGKMTVNERRISGPGLFPQNYSECLQTARNLFNRSRKTANRNPYADQGISFDSRGEKLRWFMVQHEAQDILTSNSQNVKHSVPFDPAGYSGSKRTRDNKQSDIVNPAMSGTSSPRHYSLPAIDDHRIVDCSSPVPLFLQDVNAMYYSTQYSHPPVSFAVGESVSSSNLGGTPHHFYRERCLSLGAPNVSPPILSPQTRVSLGMNNLRQRNYSYSSEMHSLDSDANTSPTQSLNMLSASSLDCSQLGRASPDLQTYVTEMTKELATNIKSEIREVISRVEDVLENTDNIMDTSGITTCSEKHGSGSDDGRSDSISANDVAEYLEKVSIEMVNEVKSEIRDVVSAVDVFITPDVQDKHSYSRASSTGESERSGRVEHYTPGSSSETVIQVIRRFSDEESADNPEKSSKSRIPMTSTVASVSSQDSGINLSFQEQDSVSGEYGKRRCSSESVGNRANESEGIRFATLQRKKRKELDESKILDFPDARWVTSPKTVLETTMEAIEEHGMIRNGDKILVGLSGGKDSLSLLHALLQYKKHVKDKGTEFTIGAVTINPESCGCGFSVFASHVKNLGVDYIVDNVQEADDMGKTDSIILLKQYQYHTIRCF